MWSERRELIIACHRGWQNLMKQIIAFTSPPGYFDCENHTLGDHHHIWTVVFTSIFSSTRSLWKNLWNISLICDGKLALALNFRVGVWRSCGLQHTELSMRRSILPGMDTLSITSIRHVDFTWRSLVWDPHNHTCTHSRPKLHPYPSLKKIYNNFTYSGQKHPFSTEIADFEFQSNTLKVSFTPQPCGLEGYCRHGPGGRASDCQICVTLSYGHLPICFTYACPWSKNLSNLPQIGSIFCGTHISETAGWIYPI